MSMKSTATGAEQAATKLPARKGLAGFAFFTFITIAAFGSVCMSGRLAFAGEDYRLAPQTKLKLTVVEWVAATGEYRRWDALDGEYSVAADGTIAIPLAGVINAGSLDSNQFAAAVAKKLQTNTGLRAPPDVSAGIVEYPKIYVVGDVTNPGEFSFRPDMTALQALSLAGGRYRDRQDRAGTGIDQIKYIGDLDSIRIGLDRSVARRARLLAEAANAKSADEIQFPEKLKSSVDGQKIIAEEKAIFLARSNSLDRQIETLEELQTLLKSEISLLLEKIKTQDSQIGWVQDELNAIIPLVKKGVATASRRYEVERRMADLQSQRLDLITALMRARQNLSNASRDALSLHGQRQIEISGDLQSTEVLIEDAKQKDLTTGRLLAETGIIAARIDELIDKNEIPLTFVIVRKIDVGQQKIDATEASLVQPGDVVKIELDRQPRDSGTAPSFSLSGSGGSANDAPVRAFRPGLAAVKIDAPRAALLQRNKNR